MPYRSDGGGVYIEQTAKVIIDGTNFTDLNGRYGGALYINQDRLTTTSLTLGLNYNSLRIYSFTDIKFENCHAEFDGGAVWVKNPLKMEMRSVTFFNNTAEREGGAIDYVCEPSPLEFEYDPDSPC